MKVCSKAMRSLAVLASASSFSRGTRSILLSTRIFGDATFASLGEDRLGLLVDARRGVEQHADQVGVMRPAPGRRHHGAVEPAFRREDAGRIDQDDLGVVLDHDAADQRARGLHLARDDRDLGADQRVDQRGFADIGRADQRDEAAACRGRRGVVRRRLHPSLLPPPTPSRSIIDGGRDLFGGALAAADAFGRLKPGQVDGDAELRIVMRPGALDLAIDRRRQALALRPFLQHRLGIAQRPPRLVHPLGPVALDELRRGAA